MFDALDLPVPDDPVLRFIDYVRARWPSRIVVGVEPRPAELEGLHLRVIRGPGSGRRDWPLVDSMLICDLSHEDVETVGAAVEQLHNLVDLWPWADPGVEREPRRDPASPVYNPLDDPRVPAYTISFRVKIIAGVPAETGAPDTTERT